jgi:hypothetical protein
MSDNVLPIPQRGTMTDEDRKRLLSECRSKWTATDVGAFTIGDLFFILRGPTREEFKRFRVQSVAVQTRAAAQEALVLACAMHPSSEAVDTLLNRKPGLIDPLGNACMELAEGGVGAEKKDW